MTKCSQTKFVIESILYSSSNVLKLVLQMNQCLLYLMLPLLVLLVALTSYFVLNRYNSSGENKTQNFCKKNINWTIQWTILTSSSELSKQSPSRSHLHLCGMHFPLLHINWSALHSFFGQFSSSLPSPQSQKRKLEKGIIFFFE